MRIRCEDPLSGSAVRIRCEVRWWGRSVGSRMCERACGEGACGPRSSLRVCGGGVEVWRVCGGRGVESPQPHAPTPASVTSVQPPRERFSRREEAAETAQPLSSRQPSSCRSTIWRQLPTSAWVGEAWGGCGGGEDVGGLMVWGMPVWGGASQRREDCGRVGGHRPRLRGQ